MYFSLLAIAGLSLASCGGAESTEVTESTYTLDAKATTLAWAGDYVSDGHSHNGTVSISEGTMVYKGDEFVSGEFIVDLNTIVDEDLPAPLKDTLVAHLKGGYFFNVAENNSATVVVNTVSEKEITATITVLGKEVKATMPVKVSKDDKKLTATGKFEIDFSSAELMGFQAAPDKPENERVNPVFKFELNLVLNKQ